MNSRNFSWLWWCCALAMACQRDKPPEPKPQAAKNTALEVAAALPEAKTPAGLVLELDAVEGDYQLHIQNRGTSRVMFSSKLSLERKQQEIFEAVSGQQLHVTSDCDTRPEPCIALAPGAERVPVSLGWREGDMQCNNSGAQLAAGEYRVVLHG